MIAEVLFPFPSYLLDGLQPKRPKGRVGIFSCKPRMEKTTANLFPELFTMTLLPSHPDFFP